MSVTSVPVPDVSALLTVLRVKVPKPVPAESATANVPTVNPDVVFDVPTVADRLSEKPLASALLKDTVPATPPSIASVVAAAALTNLTKPVTVVFARTSSAV